MFRRFAFLAVLTVAGAWLLPPTGDWGAVAQTIGSGCISCGQGRTAPSHWAPSHSTHWQSQRKPRVQTAAQGQACAQRQSCVQGQTCDQGGSTAAAQGIRLAPGERLLSVSPIGSSGQVVVDGGAVVTRRPSQSVSRGNAAVAAAASQQPLRAAAAAGKSAASNVLGVLNNQRARRGLASLSPDPALQAVAERRAQQMAASGHKNHPPGSFAPGRYEGVGWSSSFSPSGVSACFTDDPRMRAAGAAMAVGRDGVYFAVVYR